MTLSVQRSRLNITARKSTTYGVLAYIDQCLQKMRTRTIDVAPYLPRDTSLPNSSELKELGRLTKTSIRRIKEGTKNVCPTGILQKKILSNQLLEICGLLVARL